MNITAITRQGRQKSRYSVYVDGKYAFGLSTDALLETKLFVGQSLDTTQIRKYKKLSTDDKAYNLALAYVLRRMRSSCEFSNYCEGKGYGETLSQRIRHRLEQLGLIDDEKFARAWIRNRRLLKPMSKRRLKMELRKKGVSEEIIEQAMSEDIQDERIVLLELVERRRKQSNYQDDLSLMQYLARQGFNYDDIKAVLQNAND